LFPRRGSCYARPARPLTPQGRAYRVDGGFDRSFLLDDDDHRVRHAATTDEASGTNHRPAVWVPIEAVIG
jgi:hypothetical protein